MADANQRPIIPAENQLVLENEPPRGRASKGPCNCGCVGKLPWGSKVRASPDFKKQVDDGVKSLVEKAKQVKTNGRQL